jgi:hypothetical protein
MPLTLTARCGETRRRERAARGARCARPNDDKEAARRAVTKTGTDAGTVS